MPSTTRNNQQHDQQSQTEHLFHGFLLADLQIPCEKAIGGPLGPAVGARTPQAPENSADIGRIVSRSWDASGPVCRGFSTPLAGWIHATNRSAPDRHKA
jgi:hypothetical protein